MRISELIEKLEEIKAVNGDLPVCYPGWSDELEEIDSIDVGRGQDKEAVHVEVWNEEDNQARSYQ